MTTFVEPTILWKGQTFSGIVECNSVLHRIQSGVLPMSKEDIQKLAKHTSNGDETLSKLSDEEVLSEFEITDQKILERICTIHGRTMQLDWKDISMKTNCVNTTDGTVLEYPKVFRITGSPDFDTDFLARLHILRRKEDNAPGEEFVKVLGCVTWFMVVEDTVAKVEVPKGYQIFYHGFVEHGALLDTVAEFVTCTQIIGPSEWELEATGRENSLLEDTKRRRLEATKKE